MELAGDAGEGSGADEAEGLVAGDVNRASITARSMRSPWAWLKSVIRSALAPPTLSARAVNWNRSAPAPPVTVSLPARPTRRSLPFHPCRTLAPALLYRLSQPWPPERFPMPERVSPCASPPLPRPLARLTPTPDVPLK